MKTNCPKCSTAIIVDAHEVVYDDEPYAARCPSCQTHLIAHATVVVTYQLEVAECDNDGPLRYLDDSVDVRVDAAVDAELAEPCHACLEQLATGGRTNELAHTCSRGT